MQFSSLQGVTYIPNNAVEDMELELALVQDSPYNMNAVQHNKVGSNTISYMELWITWKLINIGKNYLLITGDVWYSFVVIVEEDI